MKETVTKVIDTLTQEDFDGAFQKLLEWYAECIAAGGDYFEGDCCILTSDPAKHAIPKTAEVAYYVGQLWEEIA